jgi:hypothetical protein
VFGGDRVGLMPAPAIHSTSGHKKISWLQVALFWLFCAIKE